MKIETYVEASKHVTLLRRAEELQGILARAREESWDNKEFIDIPLGLLKELELDAKLTLIIEQAKLDLEAITI